MKTTNIYKCLFCDYDTDKKFNLKRHYLTHKNKEEKKIVKIISVYVEKIININRHYLDTLKYVNLLTKIIMLMKRKIFNVLLIMKKTLILLFKIIIIHVKMILNMKMMIIKLKLSYLINTVKN